MRTIQIESEFHIVLEAMELIPPYSVLTVDYGWTSSLDSDLMRCMCGAATCSGTVVKRVSKRASTECGFIFPWL